MFRRAFLLLQSCQKSTASITSSSSSSSNKKVYIKRVNKPTTEIQLVQTLQELGRSGTTDDFIKALIIWKDMYITYSIRPNIYHLSTLIGICNQHRRWRIALGLYNRNIKHYNIQLNTILINKFLITLGTCKRIHELNTIFTHTNSNNSRILDVNSYCIIMKTYYKCKLYTKAYEIYEIFKNKQYIINNNKNGGVILNILINHQNYDQARIVFDDMRARKLVNEITYCILMTGYLSKSDLNLKKSDARYDALAESAEMAELFFKDGYDIYNSISGCIILEIYIKSKQYDAAHKLFTLMRERGLLNLVVYCAAIKAYSDTRQYEQAYDIYLSFKESNLPIDIKGSSIILKMLVKARKLDDARFFMSQMADLHLLNELCFSFILEGHHEAQEQGVDEIVKLYNTLSNDGQVKLTGSNTRAMCILLNTLVKSSQYTEAERLFDEMRRQQRLNIVSYCTMIDGYYQQNDMTRAFDVFLLLVMDNVAINNVIAGNIILKMLVKAKRYDDAKHLFDSLSEKGIANGDTYGHMVACYNAMGDTTRTLEMLLKAL